MRLGSIPRGATKQKDCIFSVMYAYYATLEKVVDGDTLELNIDLGFKVFVKVRVRLLGVDTPEIYGVKKESEEYQKGMLASQFTKDWFAALGSKGFLVKTEKDKQEKYGRWLATITSLDGSKILNEDLLASGNAVQLI